MKINDLSLMAWNHLFVCMLALIVGPMQVGGEKGTPTHAIRGNIYVRQPA